MNELKRDQYTVSDDGLTACLTVLAHMEFELRATTWMIENYTEHVDDVTSELNITLLAEEAADVFGLIVPEDDARLQPGCDIPEDVFEWSQAVESLLVMCGKVKAI